MNHFQLIGWPLPTLAEAIEKALLVLKELAEPSGGVSVEAHCADLEILKVLTRIAPSERCAYFGWKRISDIDELKKEDYSLVRRAMLTFDRTTISIKEFEDLPPYDWNETVPPFSHVSLKISHPTPLKPEEKEPSPKLVELLTKIGAELCGEFEPLKTSTSWKDSSRDHLYLLKVPRERIIEVTRTVCAGLSLNLGTGSFEFSGRDDQIGLIAHNQEFQSQNFPEACWNLNYPADTVFSFGSAVFHLPLPNVQFSRLVEVGDAIDGLKERVQYRSVVKKYLSWKISPNTCSPRVQGNYLLISQQKDGVYAIFLGFERYEDKDPTVRRFTSFAEPVLERMGLQLKKVSGPS